MNKRAIIILNAKAGSDDKNDELRQKLEAGFKDNIDVKIHFAEAEELVSIIEKSISEKPNIMIGGGGDGTINAVASRLLKTDITFGILPLGTLNHFAKDSGIPLEIDAAVQNIIAGNVVKIDAAEVNGTVFLNNSSLGLYPNIVHKREKEQEKTGSGKWNAFMHACIDVLKKYPMVKVRIEAEGNSVIHTTPFVFIGNNSYIMEGFSMGGRNSLTEGKLSLFIAHRTGRLGLLRLAFKALLGNVRQDKDFDAFSVEEIFIESNLQSLKVSTDGEVNDMKTPLHYKILPAALSVIIPKK